MSEKAKAENKITAEIKLPDKVTVKIKLPDKKIIEVKTNPEATFKDFLAAAVEQHNKMKTFGYVKFRYIPRDLHDRNKKSEQGEIVSIWYIQRFKRGDVTYYFKIKDFCWYKDEYELSLIPADDDPCAINLNDLDETKIREKKIPVSVIIKICDTASLESNKKSFDKVEVDPCYTFEGFIRKVYDKVRWGKLSHVKFSLNDKMLSREGMKQTIGALSMAGENYTIILQIFDSKDENDGFTVKLDEFRDTENDEEIDTSLRKINWPRIIVGGVTLLLLAVTATLFLLFSLSSLNIPLIAPIISAVVFLAAFIFWAAWNKIVPKNFEGGIIYKPLSENDNNYVKENNKEKEVPLGSPEADIRDIQDIAADIQDDIY